MNILLITQSYPSDSNQYALAYIHTRVLEYKNRNLEVEVLSFSADRNYIFEGVNVITYQSFSKFKNYEVLISHAPNIRNHIPFILRHLKLFKKYIFFFHGHEVMNVATEYPPEYSWVTKRSFIHFIHLLYSPIKFCILKFFFRFLINKFKVKFIFVSDWMQNIFTKNIFTPPSSLCSVVNNPANEVFFKSSHVNNNSKRCITIRPWDKSKYAVDLVLNFARNNPDYNFDIYGSGKFPILNDIPDNCTFIEGFFRHDQLPEILNKYQYAIFPTRLDAQGITACEIASYGMPLYVNNIPIMSEMLSDFDNVFLVNNIDFIHEISDLDYINRFVPENKFQINCIVDKEVEIIYE